MTDCPHGHNWRPLRPNVEECASCGLVRHTATWRGPHAPHIDGQYQYVHMQSGAIVRPAEWAAVERMGTTEESTE